MENEYGTWAPDAVEPAQDQEKVQVLRESINVLVQAMNVQVKKSQDYQNPNSTVVQADYYPNGVLTIQDVIWGKVLRAKSLLESGQDPNFESLEDTYVDIINYCSFAVAWLRGGVPGQRPDRDIFNKPKGGAG